MSTQDTNHDQTTDPTPRTAATARERDIYETVREVIRDYTCLPFGLGEAKEMCSRITSALAAAEAPGRVAALEAALRRIADLDPDLDAEAEAAALASAKRIASNALAAPAPTPSEPEGRCCDQPADGLNHRCWSGYMRRQRRVGDGLHVIPTCHPFTPGGRDE